MTGKSSRGSTVRRALRSALRIGVLVVLVGGGWSVNTVRGALARRELNHFLTGPVNTPSATYYVRAAGSDTASGTSTAAAWRTLARVNQATLRPGDRVLLRAGEQFAGTLRLDAGRRGRPEAPITIGAFGTSRGGRATIQAGENTGIHLINTCGIRIQDLQIVGKGRTQNDGSGILIENYLPGDLKLPFIHLERLNIEGFGGYGVCIDGNNGKSGFRDVQILDVETHDNNLAGLMVLGEFRPLRHDYAHQNVLIRRVRAYRNTGVAGPNRPHSGSGIVLSDVSDGRIEQCTAFANGARCESREGGPVGIWAWDARRIMIQHCESYGNRVAGPKDGGGFDLDGGVTDSVIQYCYSHDNDGAGFLLAQFPYAQPFSNNAVRCCISENDGRRNGYGGIAAFGPMRAVRVYNNTVFVTGMRETREKAPCALQFFAGPAQDFLVANNIFLSRDGALLLNAETGATGLIVKRNAYFTFGQPENLVWQDQSFASVNQWRQSVGQETEAGRSLAITANPRLRNPGIIDRARGGASASAYELRADSPLRDAGRPFPEKSAPARDFFGNPRLSGRLPDIGAHELPEKGSMP